MKCSRQINEDYKHFVFVLPNPTDFKSFSCPKIIDFDSFLNNKNKFLRLRKAIGFSNNKIKDFEVIKISNSSIQKIGKIIKKAGNLDTFPLAIYGSDKVPDNAIPMCSIDKCVAKAILINSVDNAEPPLYIGKETIKGCCPGAMTYLGYIKPLKFIKYFVSTGNEKFRGGEAEYLKKSPEIVEGFLESIGKIKSFGKYLVIQKCSDIDEDVDIKSILCFGNGEQIRNLSSLIHFGRKNPFNAIDMPFGPACATFVTYPTGMAEKTPKDTAFVGPVDPIGNVWFPPEYMALGIPMDIAGKMHEDYEDSFAAKRPQVANPQIRDNIKNSK